MGATVVARRAITDGRPVRAEPSKAQGCAFQLTVEEAKATSDVVSSMFLSFISFIIYVLCLYVVPMNRYILSKLLACVDFIRLGGQSVVCVSDIQWGVQSAYG